MFFLGLVFCFWVGYCDCGVVVFFLFVFGVVGGFVGFFFLVGCVF